MSIWDITGFRLVAAVRLRALKTCPDSLPGMSRAPPLAMEATIEHVGSHTVSMRGLLHPWFAADSSLGQKLVAELSRGRRGAVKI